MYIYCLYYTVKTTAATIIIQATVKTLAEKHSVEQTLTLLSEVPILSPNLDLKKSEINGAAESVPQV